MSRPARVDREHLIDEIKRLMPDPLREEKQLDGSLVIIGGDPGEVVVRVKGGKVSVAEFPVSWEGPHTPLLRPKQVATLNWERVPASPRMMILRVLIEAARDSRRAEFRNCEAAAK